MRALKDNITQQVSFQNDNNQFSVDKEHKSSKDSNTVKESLLSVKINTQTYKVDDNDKNTTDKRNTDPTSLSSFQNATETNSEYL